MGVKLIEVALPLDAINAAAAREKSIRHGHPSTLHLWWARRPLAAARAVLFASLVDDPSSPAYRWPDGDPRARSADEITAERTRLHELIEQLVRWENSTNETVLGKARAEIMRATDGKPPPVLDPFAGGGSIPLEAQRLGLEAHASDLNPVAVLITKALIELPPKFAGQAPVNPVDRNTGMGAKWQGAAGLAADVRSYGQWMRDAAARRIGHLYPTVHLPPEQGGGAATVIAWLWARTVACPNPACGAQMPLVSSFWLSKKAGRNAWIVPEVDGEEKVVHFTVQSGKGEPPDPPKLGRGARFRCLVCGQAAPEQHIKDEGAAKRMGAQLMATVAEGSRGRVYIAPTAEQEHAATGLVPAWKPEQPLANDPRNLWCIPYGLTTFGDLFTPRQLVALTTFSDLVGEARERVRADAVAAGRVDDGVGIAAGGTGATAYADAVATYLAFAVDRSVDRNSTICTWDSSPKMEALRNTFGRQAIPMTWDFAEGNPFSASSGNWNNNLDWVCKVLDFAPASAQGEVKQQDATMLTNRASLVSTDPPYYDNIGYADLSDFFYIWLRRSVANAYPSLFRTLLVPKNEELVATPYRFDGGKQEAERFFENGLRASFHRLRDVQDGRYPFTVYYAFKQSEGEITDDGGKSTASTGWETMLEGLIHSGFSITATWPMRTELSNRMIGRGTNALASSIVLACRTRPENAPSTTRNEFLRRLRRELPRALKTMQQSSIAPVDLAQAAIGPGMRIYSEYASVREPNGERLRVRTALQLINQVLDETLTEQDSEHDRETGWAVAWFEHVGMSEGAYGRAETLATARAVSVEGLRQAGIVTAGRGKVQLIPRGQLPDDWDPARDRRLTDWEIAQHLIRALENNGQKAAARLKRQLGGRAELAKELAYRLYTICERKGWAQDALSYNGLVVNWPEISKLASGQVDATEQQAGLV